MFLRKTWFHITCGKCFYGTFFAFDVLLNIPTRATFSVNLLRGDGDEVIPEKIQRRMFF
jgi:hypothetical protein